MVKMSVVAVVIHYFFSIGATYLWFWRGGVYIHCRHVFSRTACRECRCLQVPRQEVGRLSCGPERTSGLFCVCQGRVLCIKYVQFLKQVLIC